jgi:hypothetical protein
MIGHPGVKLEVASLAGRVTRLEQEVASLHIDFSRMVGVIYDIDPKYKGKMQK